MQLEERKELLIEIGQYMLKNDAAWQQTKQKAYTDNNWFIPEFVNLAVKNIAENYLQKVE